MQVLLKCFTPEYYDAADHAVIELTEDLVLMLDKRIAQAKAIYESGFFGTKWWDYVPTFIPVGGPKTVGLDDMDEEDFDRALESNSYIQLPDSFDPTKADYAPMSPVVLTFCVSSGENGTIGGFYWTGTDKYIGSTGRVETYEMHEDTIDEWAELIGCTEMLKKVRQCRGIKTIGDCGA